MKNDFDMIIRHFPANDDIKIIPIADVHLGASEHMTKEWERFVSTILDDRNAYIVLAGDLINNTTRNSIGNVFEETMRPREQKRRMAEQLAPLRERILCSVPGNHEWRSGKDADDDPTYDIMCKLDLEDIYRENMAFLKIQIGNIQGDGQRNPTYTFCVTHGNGSSIYTGAAGTKAERFGTAIDGIDGMIIGHNHKPANYPVGKILVDTRNNQVSVKPWRMVITSSWLNYSSYAARKLLTPTVHCPQEILLSGCRKELKVLM